MYRLVFKIVALSDGDNYVVLAVIVCGELGAA